MRRHENVQSTTAKRRLGLVMWQINNITINVNKNCSVYTLLTATDWKPQKSQKGNVNHTNIAWMSMLVRLTSHFMIYAVFDPSPLTVCINCSFLHLSMLYSKTYPFIFFRTQSKASPFLLLFGIRNVEEISIDFSILPVKCYLTKFKKSTISCLEHFQPELHKSSEHEI